MTENDGPRRLIPVPHSPQDEDEDVPIDTCPAGGEHDVVEVGAATNRGQPLFRYCRKCREAM